MLKLEATGFGWIVANGTHYDRDLAITADGQILPRPKHLSKKYGGWHTVLGPEEIESALAGIQKFCWWGVGNSDYCRFWMIRARGWGNTE